MTDQGTVNNSDDDLEIQSIAEEQKKKDSQFKMGAIVLVAVLLVVGYMAATGESEKKSDDLEAKVAKDYEINERNLTIPPPRKVRPATNNELLLNAPDLSKRQEPILIRPEPKLVLTNIDTESKDEKKARLKAEKLWQKRRNADPVVYDEKAQQLADEKGLVRRHKLDVDKLSSDLMKNVNSMTGTDVLGANNTRDKMAKRLLSAKTSGVTASYIAEKPYTIAEGKMLGCVLETAIHSALPGMTRCVLSENIFSYDGSQLLLKKGSRLVGQYEGGIQAGEDRIFVIWTRIITPGGIDISLDSPGTGELGRAGHGVYVDSHFFERFGASALLSIVGGLAASENNGDIRVAAVGDSFNKSAEIALKESIKIRPTGHKNQGERVKVFVARDIDFAPVLHLANQQIVN